MFDIYVKQFLQNNITLINQYFEVDIMAISKIAKSKQTGITLETAYTKLKSILGKFTKTAFADILQTSKQNIGKRMSYGGYLLNDEAVILRNYMAKSELMENDLYSELSQIVNPVRSKHQLKKVNVSDNNDDEFTEISVKGDIGLSCGYGAIVYNNDETGKCKVPTRTLRELGANKNATHIVYAQGNSMTPEIQSGDALLVDTSQTDIIDGVVYAFNYDGQPMCKRLSKIGKKIKAISNNPSYAPFIIDFKNISFDIVGRVVGFVRPVL